MWGSLWQSKSLPKINKTKVLKKENKVKEQEKLDWWKDNKKIKNFSPFLLVNMILR